MGVVFGSWKYLFRNIWFVLPFALLPALFLSLSLDYSAIRLLVTEFFAGNPRLGFLDYFCAWSFVGTDGLRAIYAACAFVLIGPCMTIMLSLVEKHMRIGKRTPSGAFYQLGNLLLSAYLISFLYFALYEIWAITVSAVMFAISEVKSTAAVYALNVVCFLAFSFILLYLSTIFYLWFPCKQVTGFGAYTAFLYSYRLMSGVRWKIIASFAISCGAMFLIIGGFAYFSHFFFCLGLLAMFTFAFLNFGIRMETVYFATDKLDREDLLQSYREL